MIGNDIVDLTQAKQESNWQRKGFLHKLFTLMSNSLFRRQAIPNAWFGCSGA
ncbi:hypothetical protein [Spirosoma telluris]|uniref:hypothetical protein n=1 Tax=Spirosoma telluris TaxID=2183553 RepID=UPI002FC3303A